MRRFKLHTKTTLLSSVIIVAMLLAALVITSAAIADIASCDPETLTRAANLIKGTRPNILGVCIWLKADFSQRRKALRVSRVLSLRLCAFA